MVGVIPGPKELELTLNTFLQPLVDDLLQLWSGVEMKTYNKVPVIVRAALLCVGCDIPAARKVSGFLGHRATKGCSRCQLSFPTDHFSEKADYTNFNRVLWEKRDNASHRLSEKHKVSNTKNTKVEKVEIEKKYGVRYSCSLQLPYFYAPRMCVIDPMHNLLSGTAKHCIDIWKSTGLLSSDHFCDIQKKVDNFTCPNDVGRIPSKIQSSFSGFTADQWKSWTVLFSLYCLKNILPSELQDADDCMLRFCKVC